MRHRMLPLILLAALLWLVPGSAFANSGPVYWPGYPAGESWAVEKNSPIAVEHEKLLFDFSQQQAGANSLLGDVCATYQMVNTAAAPVAAQMAFPFVGSATGLHSETVRVEAAGKAVPYTVYLGQLVQQEAVDFSVLTETLSDEVYDSPTLPADLQGTRYRYVIHDLPPTTERYEITFEVTLAAPSAFVLADGINGYGWDDAHRHYTATCWVQNGTVIEFLVFGSQWQPLISGSASSGEPLQSATPYYHLATREEVGLYPYLLQRVKEKNEINPAISEVQYYNVLAQELEHNVANQERCVPLDDLLSVLQYERVITLRYEVDFEAAQKQQVTVAYQAACGMDRRGLAAPLYTFYYFLEPASYWQDFGTLDVEIRTPKHISHLVESSLAFQGNKGIYRAAFSQLPKENLKFSLYSAPTVTTVATQGGSNMDFSQVFIFLVMTTLVIAFISLSYMNCRKGKRDYLAALKEQEEKSNRTLE